MAIAKEQLQQIITDNDIKSVGDIYSLFKDSFKDMLQELMEQISLKESTDKSVK